MPLTEERGSRHSGHLTEVWRTLWIRDHSAARPMGVRGGGAETEEVVVGVLDNAPTSRRFESPHAPPGWLTKGTSGLMGVPAGLCQRPATVSG